MGRSKKKASRKFITPENEYIFSSENITIKELSEKWKGLHGCSFPNLKDRCAKENWRQRRKRHWAEMARKENEVIERETIERKQAIIEKAREKHFQGGAKLMDLSNSALKDGSVVTRLCPHCKKRNTFRLTIQEQMNPQATIRAMQVGIDIQRKGLGLEDLHFHFNETKQVINTTMEVIEKYVTEPDLYRSIRNGLLEVLRKEQERVDVAMEGSKTVDALPCE